MYTRVFLISFGSTLRADPAVPAEVIGVLRAQLGAVRSAPLVLRIQGQHARRARGVGVFAMVFAGSARDRQVTKIEVLVLEVTS